LTLVSMPIFIKIREGRVGRCHFIHQLKNFFSLLIRKQAKVSYFVSSVTIVQMKLGGDLLLWRDRSSTIHRSTIHRGSINTLSLDRGSIHCRVDSSQGIDLSQGQFIAGSVHRRLNWKLIWNVNIRNWVRFVVKTL
jgi:hypothetical protein